MRLREWLPFRRRDPAPEPERGPVARPPEWPRLPPLQRSMGGPSLVTDPARFRSELATWGNPSFLGTPGHLLSTEAPAGSVSGLAVPIGRPSPEEPALAAGEEWGSTAPARASSPSGTPVQRSAAGAAVFAPRPVPSTPLSGQAPAAGDGFLSAASAPVPAPVARPTVPMPPPESAPPGSPPDAPAASGSAAPAAAVVQRQPVAARPLVSAHEVPRHGSEPEAPWARPVADEALPPEAGATVQRVEPLQGDPVTPTLGAAPGGAGTSAAEQPAGDRAAADPPPTAVQLIPHDAGEQLGTGRRRLGLGAPLPASSFSEPSWHGAPSAPRWTSPATPPAARQLDGMSPAVQRLAPPVDRATAGGVEPVTAVASAPGGASQPPADLSVAEPEGETARIPTAPTLGADGPGVGPAGVPDPGDPARRTAPAPAVQRQRATPAPDTSTPIAFLPARSLPVASPRATEHRSTPVAQRADTPPAAVPAAMDEATKAGDPGALAPPDLLSATGSAVEASSPLVGEVAPLPSRRRPDAGVQRQVDSRPDAEPVAGLSRTGAAATSAGPAVPFPVWTSAAPRQPGGAGSVPTVQRLAAATTSPLTVPDPEAPRISAQAAPVSVDAVSSAGDVLPVSGSGVAPLGARPLQRRLADRGDRLVERGASGGQDAEALQQSVPAPAEGAGRPSSSAWQASPVPVARAASATSVSRVPAAPPLSRSVSRSTGGPGFPAGPAPLPVQTLISLPDVPAQPALPAAALVPAAAPFPRAVDTAVAAPEGLPATPAEPLAAAAGAIQAAGAAATGGAPPAVPAAADVDALVRRLYDPLARRLRAELRLDRERVGRALDLRH